MSKHMVSKWALCPFYKHEDSQVIYCDGMQDGVVLHLAFCNKTTSLGYKKHFCRDKYSECMIYNMLSEDKNGQQK